MGMVNDMVCASGKPEETAHDGQTVRLNEPRTLIKERLLVGYVPTAL